MVQNYFPYIYKYKDKIHCKEKNTMAKNIRTSDSKDKTEHVGYYYFHTTTGIYGTNLLQIAPWLFGPMRRQKPFAIGKPHLWPAQSPI